TSTSLTRMPPRLQSIFVRPPCRTMHVTAQFFNLQVPPTPASSPTSIHPRRQWINRQPRQKIECHQEHEHVLCPHRPTSAYASTTASTSSSNSPSHSPMLGHTHLRLIRRRSPRRGSVSSDSSDDSIPGNKRGKDKSILHRSSSTLTKGSIGGKSAKSVKFM